MSRRGRKATQGEQGRIEDGVKLQSRAALATWHHFDGGGA